MRKAYWIAGACILSALCVGTTRSAEVRPEQGVDIWRNPIEVEGVPVSEAADLALLDGGLVPSTDLDVPWDAWNLAYAGGYLYAAARNDGLHVFEASNPNELRLVGQVPGVPVANGVAVEGDVAGVVVADGVAVLDVSDPATPSVAGFVTVDGSVRDVAVRGGFLFVGYAPPGSTTGVIARFDVRVPSAPTQAGSVTLESRYRADALEHDGGDRIYAVGGRGISAIEATGAMGPRVLGQIPAIGGAMDVEGDLVFTAIYGTLEAYDFSDAESPVLLSRGYLPTGGGPSATDLTVLDAIVYVTMFTNGVVAFDLSDPTEFRLLRQYAPRFGRFFSCHAEDGQLFISSRLGLSSTDAGRIRDVPSPITVDMPHSAERVRLRGRRAYVLGSGVTVVDLIDAAAPRTLGSHVGSPMTGFAEVSADGRYAYGATPWYSEFHVVEVADDGSVSEVGMTKAPGDILAATDGYVYTILNREIRIVDVHDPRDPVLLDQAVPVWRGSRGTVAGGRLYTVASRSVRVYDVSDPTTPSELASFDVESPCADVDVVGRTAYFVCAQPTGVLVLDLTDPRHPVEVAHREFYGEPVAIAVDSSGVAAVYERDMFVLEHRPDGTLRLTGHHSVSPWKSSQDVAFVGGLVLSTRIWDGLLVWNRNPGLMDVDVTGADRVQAVVPRGYAPGVYDVAILDEQGELARLGNRYEIVHRENHPPVAVAGPDVSEECTSPRGAVVTLDGSESSDPDSTPGTNDDIERFVWFVGEEVVGTEAVTRTEFALGAHEASIEVTDRASMSDRDEVIVEVADTSAPEGQITSPSEGGCFAEAVTVLDNFEDRCDDALDRTYEPEQGPTYDEHGDHHVRLTVTDDSRNLVEADVRFTIDRIRPEVQVLWGGRQWLQPASVPAADVFGASDTDGASGDVVREALDIDGCIVFDGLNYGDGDGLLSDEHLPFGPQLICRIRDLCGVETLENPVLRVVAEDCAGNVGEASRTLPGSAKSLATFCAVPATPGAAAAP